MLLNTDICFHVILISSKVIPIRCDSVIIFYPVCTKELCVIHFNHEHIEQGMRIKSIQQKWTRMKTSFQCIVDLKMKEYSFSFVSVRETGEHCIAGLN